MGVEYELKFAAEPRQLSAIRQAFPGPVTCYTMETTYYDTADGALAKRHITLRRRMENGTAVCTLKTPGVGAARGEWDCLCDTIEEAIPALCKLSGYQQLGLLTIHGVQPLCGARFTRQALLLEQPDFTAELALDQGVLLGGGKEIPLCEVELELKEGSEASLNDFAAAFAQRFGLSIEKKSKFSRAKALAKGE